MKYNDEVSAYRKKLRLIICYHTNSLSQKYGNEAFKWPEDDEDMKMVNAAVKELDRVEVDNSINPQVDTKKLGLGNATQTLPYREKKIIKLLNDGYQVKEISQMTQSSKQSIYKIAKTYNIKIYPLFSYWLHSNDPDKSDYFVSMKSAIKLFFGYSHNTYVNPIKLAISGYKLIVPPKKIKWQEIPMGAYFGVSEKEPVRRKTSNNFNECEEVSKFDLPQYFRNKH